MSEKQKDKNVLPNTNISTLTKAVLDHTGWRKGYEDVLALKSHLNRELFIGDIDDETGDSIVSLIQFFNKQDEEDGIPAEERKPIKIYINSDGGHLQATLSMVDAISMSKTPVWTINIASAYSGGFFTFIAGHRRFAYPNSSFLFHEGSTSSGTADAGKFRNYADFYNKQIKIIKNITLKYTNLDEEWYKTHANDDVWFVAEEALEAGVCDEIVTELI